MPELPDGAIPIQQWPDFMPIMQRWKIQSEHRSNLIKPLPKLQCWAVSEQPSPIRMHRLPARQVSTVVCSDIVSKLRYGAIQSVDKLNIIKQLPELPNWQIQFGLFSVAAGAEHWLVFLRLGLRRCGPHVRGRRLERVGRNKFLKCSDCRWRERLHVQLESTIVNKQLSGADGCVFKLLRNTGRRCVRL